MNKILSKEVSAELAKLLFEKQIVIDTEKIWLTNAEYGLNNFVGDVCIHWMEEQGYRSSDATYNAPTIAEVLDFIFEKYNISIYYNYNHNIRSSFESPFIPRAFSIIKDIQISLNDVKSPLEAYEEAIKYILNTEI